MLSILRGETSAQEAARKHRLPVAEIEDWQDRFLSGAENSLRAKPRDDEALREEELKRLKQKVGELVMDNDILKEAVHTVAVQELYLSVDLASILAAAVETPELSPRELDALRLYASGLSINAVGRKMGISPHTAKEYLDRVRSKYGAVGRTARTRTELYAAARTDGLIPD